MKRIISIALACAVAFVGLTAQPALAVCGLTGSGTAASPYLVASAANLQVVGSGGCDSGANTNQHYKLTADIALSGNWTPRNLEGTSGDPAVLDGNGKTISGLQVNAGNGTGGDNAGLFGYINFAEVTNLTITGTNVFGRNLVGALAGDATNLNVNLVKVSMTANVAGGLSLGDGISVGGLIGRLGSTSSIQDSYFKSTAIVVGQDGTGGIVGRALDAPLIRNVGAITTINGTANAGGVVGYLKPTSGSLTLDSVFYNGTLIANQNVGGVVGFVDGYSASTLTVRNSASRGTIRTKTNSYLPATFVGLTGSNISSVTFINSYASGRYQSNSDTAAADINPVVPMRGAAAYSWQDTVFERTVGVTQSYEFTTGQAAFNSAVFVPETWTLWVKDHNYRISGVNWVIDTVGSLNNSRPMPAGVYNTGIFGTIDFSCLPGTFSASGLAPCAPTPAGSFTAGYGAQNVNQCALGTYTSNSGMSYCLDAPIGTFINALGSASATPCAPGTTTYVARSIACEVIPSSGGYARYSGPLVKALQHRTFPGDKAVLSGSNLTGISAVKIDSVAVVFEVRNGDTLVLNIPTNASLGVKSLVVVSDSGLITVDGALLVTEKPLAFAVTFTRVKNKLTAQVASPENFVMKLNGKEVASQHGSGKLTKVLALKKGKNYVDVILNGALKKRALFTVK